MEKNYSFRICNHLFLLVALFFALHPYSAQNIQNFNYTGATQTFVVPSCVTSISVTARGAQGGTSGYAGGLAGFASGVMTVTPGQTLYINVGGMGTITAGGFNGGGNGGVSPASSGGGGGGATDIRLNSNVLAARVLVAGGGGGSGGSTSYNATAGNGGGGSSCNSPLGVGGGGAGGCATGNAGGCTGGTASGYGTGGGGGGVTSGGPTAGSSTGTFGQAGSFGIGGDGGSYTGATFCNGGGGGGGGYYGGAGGMSGSGGCNGGGGGGSSYADVSVMSSVTFSAGSTTYTGNGFVQLAYVFNGSTVSIVASPTAICLGNSAVLTASGSVSYTWNTGSNNNNITVSPSSNTTYTVQGTNNLGCVSQALVTLTVSTTQPTVSVLSSTNAVCLGQTATLTASGALSYTWSNSVLNGVSFNPSVTTTYTVVGSTGCGTSSAVTTISVSPLPVSAVVNPTSSCAGSPATLTAVSAATGYTWSANAGNSASVIVSPTASTVYTIQVGNGVCSGVTSVSLNVRPIPSISVAGTSSLVCQNAAVTLTASGGLSYTWSPVASNATVLTVNPTGPTLYQVMGTNSVNCTSSAVFVVVTNPSPTVTISASDPVICAGGTSTLTATGGSNYVWSNGSTGSVVVVNPLSSITITCGSTVNNCFGSSTIQVSVFDPTLSISGQTAVCAGGTVNLTASAADTYTWNNGFQTAGITVTPPATTVYVVSATTATGNINCPSTASVQVTVNPNPTVTTAATRTIMCVKESNTLTASGANTYSWNTSATTPSIVVSSSVVTTLIYTVTGTNASGCSTSTVTSVKVNGCTGIDETGIAGSLVLYPNPNNGAFTINYSQDVELRITNELGQVIRVLQLNADNNRQAEVKGLSAGIYFVSGPSVNTKIVVEK